MPWSRPFDDPIPLPDGRALVTLQDAADYIMTLTKAEQETAPWQDAGAAVIMAAEDRGPLMLADIGMRRALGLGKKQERVKRRAKKFNIIRSKP